MWRSVRNAFYGEIFYPCWGPGPMLVNVGGGATGLQGGGPVKIRGKRAQAPGKICGDWAILWALGTSGKRNSLRKKTPVKGLKSTITFQNDLGGGDSTSMGKVEKGATGGLKNGKGAGASFGARFFGGVSRGRGAVVFLECDNTQNFRLRRQPVFAAGGEGRAGRGAWGAEFLRWRFEGSGGLGAYFWRRARGGWNSRCWRKKCILRGTNALAGLLGVRGGRF